MYGTDRPAHRVLPFYDLRPQARERGARSRCARASTGTARCSHRVDVTSSARTPPPATPSRRADRAECNGRAMALRPLWQTSTDHPCMGCPGWLPAPQIAACSMGTRRSLSAAGEPWNASEVSIGCADRGEFLPSLMF
jgi:hypothetical protein